MFFRFWDFLHNKYIQERNGEDERMVTIIGGEQQQYRAQFWIYTRVAEQTNHPLDEASFFK